ncbi:hypothetical protein O3M35_005939 [Rhynocoris fuscipes]|uniref:Uncharacterized protein n=1 Tax=Rhynocoris fuscipes TaxID=488301 RepID=A0AAW1DGR5_9HEMI
MDHGNGTKTYITDGQLGRPPQAVGTPGTLLAPDRYEFYTFGKEGELVKKLMTLDQIQSLIAAAGGDDDDDLSDQPVYYHQPLVEAGDSEGVNKVLESVHNVLKGELEAAAAAGQHSGEVPLLPDQSWTILLPGNSIQLSLIFRNSGYNSEARGSGWNCDNLAC